MMKYIAIFSVLLTLSACAGLKQAQDSKNFHQDIAKADYAKAAKIYSDTKDKDLDLLALLNLATLDKIQKNYSLSNQRFDLAESKILWTSDSVETIGDVGKYSLELLSSDLISDYKGHIFEGVLVNLFKATNYMILQENEKARIEFNRADIRSQNAIFQLGEKVNQLKKAPEKPDQAAKLLIERTLQDSDLLQRKQAVSNIGSYKNLRTAYGEYLHGIFRMNTGDYNKAADLLRNADVLSNGNIYVREEWLRAENYANINANKSAPEPKIYIIVEDGVGPKLKEFRKDVFVPAYQGEFFSIAFPEFVKGTPAFGGQYQAQSNGQKYPIMPILDLNAYVNTEFSAEYDAIVNKAIASSVIKFIAQVGTKAVLNNNSQQKNSLASALLGVVVSASVVATTHADTRIWSSLPNSINIANFARNNAEQIEIITPLGSQILELPHASAQEIASSVLITIKAPAKNPPIISVALINNAN